MENGVYTIGVQAKGWSSLILKDIEFSLFSYLAKFACLKRNGRCLYYLTSKLFISLYIWWNKKVICVRNVILNIINVFSFRSLDKRKHKKAIFWHLCEIITHCILSLLVKSLPTVRFHQQCVSLLWQYPLKIVWNRVIFTEEGRCWTSWALAAFWLLFY